MAIEKSEVKRLKGIAHHLKPIAQAGKSGLSDDFIKSVDECLIKRELVKVKFLENSGLNKNEDVQELCRKLNAELIGVIGYTIILYRFNEELKKHV